MNTLYVCRALTLVDLYIYQTLTIGCTWIFDMNQLFIIENKVICIMTLIGSRLTRVLHEGFGFRGQLAKHVGRSPADKFAWSKFERTKCGPTGELQGSNS